MVMSACVILLPYSIILRAIAESCCRACFQKQNDLWRDALTFPMPNAKDILPPLHVNVQITPQRNLN